MHRREWQGVARTRIDDAQVLLGAGQWSGAYYLSGYAIECGLKACISRRFDNNDIPERKFLNQVFTHELESLVNLAGLRESRDKEAHDHEAFDVNWSVVKDWSETARYAQTLEADAISMVQAVSHRRNGVMKWIRRHW